MSKRAKIVDGVSLTVDQRPTSLHCCNTSSSRKGRSKTRISVLNEMSTQRSWQILLAWTRYIITSAFVLLFKISRVQESRWYLMTARFPPVRARSWRIWARFKRKRLCGFVLHSNEVHPRVTNFNKSGGRVHLFLSTWYIRGYKKHKTNINMYAKKLVMTYCFTL